MPKKVPFTGNVFFRCDEEDTAALIAIDRNHGIGPAKLGAGLLHAACQFYRQHGWFSFPVVIEPVAFQAKYVAESNPLISEVEQQIPVASGKPAEYPTRRKRRRNVDTSGAAKPPAQRGS